MYVFLSSKIHSVFGMKSSTQEIFDHVAKPMVADFFTGFNGTIVAYGQTSSGKTHTMSGDSGEPGIIPLTIHKIFEEIHASVNKCVKGLSAGKSIRL